MVKKEGNKSVIIRTLENEIVLYLAHIVGWVCYISHVQNIGLFRFSESLYTPNFLIENVFYLLVTNKNCMLHKQHSFATVQPFPFKFRTLVSTSSLYVRVNFEARSNYYPWHQCKDR